MNNGHLIHMTEIVSADFCQFCCCLQCLYNVIHCYCYCDVLIIDHGKFISTNWIADCVRNYAYCFHNVLNKNPQPITFLFQKKDRKALRDSCQNISNSAANQGSQSEYLLACLFLKLLKKLNSLRIQLSNLANYFVARKEKVQSLVLPQAFFRN